MEFIKGRIEKFDRVRERRKLRDVVVVNAEVGECGRKGGGDLFQAIVGGIQEAQGGRQRTGDFGQIILRDHQNFEGLWQIGGLVGTDAVVVKEEVYKSRRQGCGNLGQFIVIQSEACTGAGDPMAIEIGQVKI